MYIGVVGEYNCGKLICVCVFNICIFLKFLNKCIFFIKLFIRCKSIFLLSFVSFLLLFFIILVFLEVILIYILVIFLFILKEKFFIIGFIVFCIIMYEEVILFKKV